MTQIITTCFEYIQGKIDKPCCSACPACDCHKKCAIEECTNLVISKKELKRRWYQEDNPHYGEMCEFHGDNLHFMKFKAAPLRKQKE